MIAPVPRIALAFGLCLLVGCSGAGRSPVSFDPDTGLRSFRTSPVPLGQPAASAYGGAGDLILRATAECVGQTCEPNAYDVTVSNPSANEVAIEFDQVAFITDQGTITFGQGQQLGNATNRVTFYNSGRGELVKIQVSPDIYNSFATSPEFSLRLGSNEYRLPYQTRAALRRILPSAEEDTP